MQGKPKSLVKILYYTLYTALETKYELESLNQGEIVWRHVTGQKTEEKMSCMDTCCHISSMSVMYQKYNELKMWIKTAGGYHWPYPLCL